MTTVAERGPDTDVVTDHPHLIGGEFRAARSGEWLDSVNPATGKVWARVPAGGAEDVEDAVTAAAAAQPAWAARPAMERAAVLRRYAAVVREHAEQLWRVDATDNGRAGTEARPAVLGGTMQVEFLAGLAETVTGQTMAVRSDALTYTVREPYGVVGVIIPWNAPLAMFLAKVAAALAAGNAVVVKPPEVASVSILAAARLLAEAGVPDGLVNVVCGLGRSAGEAMVDHPGVAKISFTGSTATGRRITQRSVGNLKALGLELGGKSPNIVFADADLDAAAAGVSAGIYTGSAGQACIAGSRILVQRDIYPQFLEALRQKAAEIRLGDPLDPETTMGPLAFDTQYAKVRGYLESAPEEGAETVFGGRAADELFSTGDPLAAGFFVEPTLFAVPDNALRVCQEEVFGPVATVQPFDTEDEAVEIANDTVYGLAAGLWTSDLSRAHRLARRLQSGSVWVNTYRALHWAVPFGGQKESGNRPSNGPDALDEWMEHKTVWIQHG